MNYPLISEYVEAIKAAEDNFDQLKHLSPVLGEDGEPVMTSGNFAVVFKMKDEHTGKLHAVKCFLKEQEGRAEAYRQIAEELEYVSSTFLTPIKYLDKELFVDSANSEDSEFPVLLMDWVEGQTLDKYIREHIDDQYELSLLAYQFSRLAMWLMPQPFAHGDLKPDNILVKEDGTLVLVDYDGMYVPAMKGQKARELGSPDFRHPSRTEEVFDDHIDDFSLASILLSLKAIALQPSLLEEYGASDRLLFSEKDYRNLSESNALGALQPLMQDSELASLYSLYILALSQNNLSQVSFRLFNLSRPDRSQYKEDNLSSEVTDEDLANAWTDEFGVKYSADRKRLFLIPNNIVDYKIRKGTKVICDYAFGNQGASGRIKNSLKSLYISADVKVISSDTLFGCQNLSQIIVDDKNSVFDSRDNCNAIIKTKSNELLLGCQTTNIPPNITSIADNAFLSCVGLNIIHIPNSVITIGSEAFMNCSQITHIHIPSSVKKIGNRTFNGCNIEEVTIDDENNVYDSRNNCNAIISSADNRLVFGCKKTIIPDTVTIIGYRAFECCELKNISIPNSVKTIEDSAFVCCSELQSIYCSSSLNSIGGFAFGGCKKLTFIRFDGVIEHIGSDAFFGCDAIKKINVPVGTQSVYKSLLGWGLGQFVFDITEVTVDDLENAWTDEYGGRYSADRRRLLDEVSMDIKEYSIIEGTQVICNWAFANLSDLASILIPDSVTTIGKWAFEECVSLISIHIPSSVTIIDNSVFKGCSSLESIFIPKGTMEKFEKLLPECKDKLVEQDEEEEICLAYCSENSQACEDKEYALWQPHSKILKKNGKLGVVIDDGTTKKLIIPFIYDTWFDYDGYEIDIRENFFDNYQDYIGYFAIKNSDGTFTIHDYDKDGTLTTSFTCEKFNPDSYSLHGKYILRYPKDEVEYDDIRRMRMYCDTYLDTSYLAFRKGNKWSLKSDDLKTTYIDFLDCDGFGSMYWTPKGYYVEIKNGEMSQICLCRKNSNLLILPDKYDYVSLRYFGTSQNNIDSVCFEIRKGDKLAVCSNDLQNISPFIFDSVGSMINNNEVKVTRLINGNKYEFIYQIVNSNGWIYNGTRPFSPEEIAAVARAEIVPSQFGNSVCFFMNGGGQTYIPLLNYSSLTIGDYVDLKTAKLVTLCREGKDDIYRVIEQ